MRELTDIEMEELDLRDFTPPTRDQLIQSCVLMLDGGVAAGEVTIGSRGEIRFEMSAEVLFRAYTLLRGQLESHPSGCRELTNSIIDVFIKGR